MTEFQELIKNNKPALHKVAKSYGVDYVNDGTLTSLYVKYGDEFIEKITAEIESEDNFSFKDSFAKLKGGFEKVKAKLKDVDFSKAKNLLNKKEKSAQESISGPAKEPVYDPKIRQISSVTTNKFIYAGIGIVVIVIAVFIYLKFKK